MAQSAPTSAVSASTTDPVGTCPGCARDAYVLDRRRPLPQTIPTPALAGPAVSSMSAPGTFAARIQRLSEAIGDWAHNAVRCRSANRYRLRSDDPVAVTRLTVSQAQSWDPAALRDVADVWDGVADCNSADQVDAAVTGTNAIWRGNRSRRGVARRRPPPLRSDACAAHW